MRRLAVSFLTILTVVAFTGCGDTGDHFGEFRQAPPPPAVAQSIALAMPIIATGTTLRASLKLYVTAYDGHGNAIPQSTTLANPIVIHSNWSGLTMQVNGKQVTGAAFGSAPGVINVTYRAPSAPCKGPKIGFAAFNQNANPQTVTIQAVKC